MQVSEIMSNRVVAVTPNDSAYSAAQLMNEHNIGAVPVENNGQLLGILTDRDIVLRCVAENRDPNQVNVSDIMTTGAAYVAPTQNVFEAMEVMSAEQVRRLPVVEDGRLTGLLSLADIARIKDGPEVSQALSEISRP